MVCEPIFEKLKKGAKTDWDQECYQVFDKIKEYLSNPPVLIPQQPGILLTLYLTMIDTARGAS